MGQEHIAVVREAFDAWNAGDMDRVHDLYHPDVIMRAPPGWPEPKSDVEMTFVGAVREGRIFYIEHLWDHDAARAAIGLDE